MARAGPGQSREPRVQARAPTWVAATQRLKASLLPPRVCTGWGLEAGKNCTYTPALQRGIRHLCRMVQMIRTAHPLSVSLFHPSTALCAIYSNGCLNWAHSCLSQNSDSKGDCFCGGAGRYSLLVSFGGTEGSMAP